MKTVIFFDVLLNLLSTHFTAFLTYDTILPKMDTLNFIIKYYKVVLIYKKHKRLCNV